MSDELTVIYRATSLTQAQLLKSELQRHGLTAFITHDKAAATTHSSPEHWDGAPRVLVASEDADAARKLVASFENNRRCVAREMEANDQDRWEDWPCCPRCSTARQVICPFCHTAGASFSLAEMIPAAKLQQISEGPRVEPEFDDKTVLLVCGTCDEPFPPRFYRHCARCGHDFGDGLQVEKQSLEQLTPRAIALVFALVLGLVVLLLWALVSVRKPTS